MNWIGISEVVVGKVLQGKYAPGAVDVLKIAPPYDQIILVMRDGGQEEDVIEKVGWDAYNSCYEAAARVNGAPVDYIEIMERAASRAEAASLIEPEVRKLQRGEEGNPARIKAGLELLQNKQNIFTRISDVESNDVVWKPTYYPPLDEATGGIVSPGMVVIGGPPGTGKTTFFLQLAKAATLAGKKIAFFSLEMTNAQIAFRLTEIDPKYPKAAQKNFLITDGVWTVDEISAHLTRLAAAEDIYFAGVDFADLVVGGRTYQNQVAYVDYLYRQLATTSKETGVPLFVLSQLNEKYVGDRPRVNHLRGSRMIEAVATEILLLYNPDRIDVNQGQGKLDNALPWMEDTAYIIQGKSRFGYKQGGVGAIRVRWEGKLGGQWGSKKWDWVPLAGS